MLQKTIESASEKTIHHFFTRYGEALGAGDLNVIVDCWGIPAFIFSDGGIQTVTESKQVEAFFRNGVAYYKSQGLASTHAEIKQIEQLGQSIYSVDLRWANLDENGVKKTTESWRYTLKVSADEQPRIHVAVMKADGV